MTPELLALSLSRLRRRLLVRRKRRRTPLPSREALLLGAGAADFAAETLEQAVLLAQSESSSGPLASGRYRR